MTAPPPSRHPHPSLPFVTKGDGCPRRPSNSGSGSGRSSASKRGRGGGSGGGGGNEGGAEEEGDDILPFDDDADPPYMDFKEAEEHAMAWVVEVVRLDAAPAALRSMCTAWRADAFLAPGGVDAAALADRFFGQQLALPVTQRLEAVGARRSAWLLAARGLQRAVRAPPEDLARLAVALPVVVHNVAMRAGADAALANGMAPEEAEEDAKAAATFNWFEEESGAMARPPATDKAKSTEMYVRAMFDGAQRSGFALGSDKAVLKQRLTPEGLPTRAWMPVEGPGGEQMDVAAMIATFSRKDVSVGPTGPFRLLCDSYSQNSKAAETLMLRGVDRQFPRLFKSRGLFSFADGLYAAHFRESPGAPEATADRFFPYSARISDLPASAVSANFFDAPVAAFVEARDWREIPTPSFDLIMEHQRWPEEYKALLYVLTGRMMYDVGTMDDWQIFPYLLGQAGSGKSLIVEQAIGNIYQHSDRGTLSSNIEKRFGLSALLGKLLVLGPEISRDMTFEQTEIQSMASGEFLKVNVKCQTGRDVRWTAPLFLAGNETPSWKDNAGSLTRRVVTLPFTVPVTPDDRRRNPDLPRRLAEEVPALIVKCNRAYRQRAIASPAHLPLPESIASTTRDVLGQTSTLAQFLAAQDRVEVGPGLTCRWTDFLAALREYERELRVPAAKSSSAQMGSSMMTDLALAPSGCRRAGTDLLGCRLVACDFGGAGMGGAGGSGGGGGIA